MCGNELSKLAMNLGYFINKDIMINFIKGDKINSDYLIIINTVLSESPRFYSILNALHSHQHAVMNVKNSFLYFKRNTTNGRLDSNLSNLPSYLRKFIVTDKELIHIDIANSQPYFLYTTLMGQIGLNEDEVERYGNLVCNGQVYEFYASKWNAANDRKIDRAKSKIYFFQILFSKPTSYQSQKDIFRNEFPTIMEWIDMKNEKCNSTVANLMANKESFTILDVIKPKLSKLDIEPYTIHDSFICNDEESPIVIKVINETLKDMFNHKPMLHVENLLDEKIMTNEYEEVDEDYDYGDIDFLFND